MRSLRRLAQSAALLALIAAAPAAHAQLLPSFGISGGLNFTNLGDAAAVTLEESVGYHIGVFGDFGFGPLGVRGSVLYVRAGNFGFPGTIPVIGGTEGAAEFIAVPVDIKYSAGLPLVNPYGLLGPELRFPLGTLTDHPDARSSGWGLNIGAGVDVGTIIGPKLFAELRYGIDLTGFADADDSIRVSLFYLRVGFGF